MAHVPSPEGSFAQPPAGARDRLRRVAAVLAHVCGLTLHMKRYIEKSRAKEWALFYLSIKNHSANELLFGISNYSKYSLIQLYLKKNRAFHSLPKEVQLQLCQTAIYQDSGWWTNGGNAGPTPSGLVSAGPGARLHPDPGARVLARTRGTASPGSRGPRPRPDPGPRLTRIQGPAASPGPGAQAHPDPGARGLARTRGPGSPGSRGPRPRPDPGPRLTRIQGPAASPGPGAQAHPDPGACGPF
ncbi:hypothetical protein QTO34_008388 [Cnephaeus nilssonii]|uniref:Uncharacterized protein n=1 Tax=Cnephaeus nilssonii TaxID=3371016 RepID=A0AA40IA71_CNENI|nr:hypothetical protein QTO34_008388 [Eptesicus nilssonii]